MHATNPKQFYTYLWLRADGTPYYVGKGKGNRTFRKGSPKDLTRILIQNHPSEADAFAAEIFLIAYYGRKDLGNGILINRTDGGEGPSGCKPSESTLKKLKESHLGQIPWNKGRPPTEKERQRLASIAANGKGRPRTEKELSALEKLADSNKGLKRTAEQRKRNGDTHRGQIAWNKGKPPSEKERQRLTEIASLGGRASALITTGKRIVTPIQAKQIQTLRAKGNTFRGITHLTGVSVGTVFRTVRELGAQQWQLNHYQTQVTPSQIQA